VSASSELLTHGVPWMVAEAQWIVLTAMPGSLALAEMKILLRDMYSRYKTVPDPDMTEGEMAMSDQLISSRPLGQRCLVRFEPVGDL
jgi:hypothetical protein